MSSEIKTITADLAKEQFLELEAMEMMTKPDAERMTEWLQVGTDKFDADYAKLIIIGMKENRVNPEAGWPRSFALIATRLFSEKEHIGSRKSRQEIHDLLVQKLGDQAGAILAEGWFDDNPNWKNKPQWEFKPTNEDNPLKTDLADKVDEAVTEFLAERKTTEAAAAPESVPAGPAVPEWGDEQKAAAEKFYNETMKPDERVKVDALVKSLLAAGQSEEIIIEAIGNLPQAKHDWDIAKGTVADFNWIAESALGEMLKADSVRKNLLAVMSIREAPKKGQDRGEQIIQHHTFYIQLADALRWRIDVIGLEREKEAKLAERKQAFIKGLDQVTLLSLPKPDGQLDERLDDLLTEVKSEFDMSLPEKLIDEVHFEEERLNQEFAKIWLRLNEGFKGGDLFIDCKAVNSEAGKVLIAMAFAKATMLTGYEFKSMEKGIQLVRTNDEAVLAVIGGEGNQFTISSENAVDLLEAAHVVGQTYLNLQGIQQDFPYFTLANLPELEKLKEPAQAVEEEAAPAPAEEAAAEAEDFWQSFGQPAKPAEPPVAKPGEASDEAELPDWMITTDEEKPGGGIT